ncbi:MerR family transcriptional regulator [Streptomyces sp. NPDC047049]|uniref:MerR family transcriptional regulator n=1 Tax=Streptomyces sp. NPDC047049 TaxID=3156688 RepID=UPI0034002042
MTEQPPKGEYRIEDLAHLSGATVRTIRAYQDRGLLPRPERRGRANVYGDTHLTRLRQIADLLDRGYSLASVKELLDAWDAGLGLGGVLGLVAEINGPWTDEEASRVSRRDLDAAFGGSSDEEAIAEAVELGVLQRIPGEDGTFLVPSPQELAVAAELHSAGVPLLAITGQLREVRAEVEHIASRFLDFTTEHVFQPFLDHPPTEAGAAEAAALVRRLRPLAQQTIDAELARAMRTLATGYLRHHLSEALPAEESGSVEARAQASAGVAGAGPAAAPGTAPGPAMAAETVLLPAEAVQAVRALVGAEHTAAFIAAAVHREVQARTMDALASDASGTAPGDDAAVPTRSTEPAPPERHPASAPGPTRPRRTQS